MFPKVERELVSPQPCFGVLPGAKKGDGGNIDVWQSCNGGLLLLSGTPDWP